MEDEELTEVYNVYADHGAVSSDGSIYLWKKRYWATADYDINEEGPFDTLEEAVERSGLSEFGEGCSVDCRALTQAHLFPLLTVHGDYFILNGRCRVKRMVGGPER